MQVTNFNFSQDESDAIGERNFFLVKNSATKKIMELFGSIERDMKDWISDHDFEVKGLNISSGKIFRGENYKLYPYILLDYPRLFSRQSVFSFRTMFWWGHEFSFSLHLEGEALERYRTALMNNLAKLYGKGVFFCVNDTPWQYDFVEENYKPLEELNDLEKMTGSKSFIKISRRLPVNSHNDLYGYCMETFKLFFTLLKSGNDSDQFR